MNIKYHFLATKHLLCGIFNGDGGIRHEDYLISRQKLPKEKAGIWRKIAEAYEHSKCR